MKEFSNLLDDDDLPILEESSILQEDTIDNESLSQSNEFSAEIDDKNDDENQFPSKQDKAKNLFDEFYSMLDESFDHSESEEIEALSDHVDTGEDPFLTMLSDNNELEEEKQDLSSTNLNEIKSVKLEDLSDHKKSHSTLDNVDHMLEKEEKDSSNAESSLSQGTKSPLQEKLYSKFKRNSPSENEFASMLKEEQPKKEENHEEDVQETASSINKEDTSIEDKNESESQFPSKQDKAKNLFDEFYSMLDESFDHSNSNPEEIEALSEDVEIQEDPFLTILSESNELEEEKQDHSSTNLNETKSVDKEDLSDHEKSHSALEKEESLLEKEEIEEIESSNAESSLSQGAKFSLQEKLYSKFKKNSPSENEFALMLKEEQPKKAANHEEDAQETASSINKEDTSIEDKNESESQFPSKQDKAKNLFDEFYSMLDESFDHSNSNPEEIEALSEDVEIQEDPFLTILSESNELEEEKQDLSSTNLNETKSVDKEDLSDHEKSHSALENEESLLEKEEIEEIESSNAESSLSQGAKFSLQEKLYSKFKKNSPSENEFALMLKEEQPKKAANHEEDAQETASIINKEDSSLLDQHAPILEVDSVEKKTESNTMKKISLMLKEEQPKKAANHEEDVQEKVSIVNKEDSSSLDKHAPILEVDPIEKEAESNTINKTSLKKKKTKKNSKNKNQYEIALLHEDNNEKSFEKNSFLIDAKDKKQSTLVKLPVLLANLNIEIDILENIKFFMPLENISKVEWSMGSLHCHVVLPSTTLFIKGVVIAEIEFINNEVNDTIHSLKVPIPWSKTTTVHWLTLPDLSHSYQNEFMFQSQHDPNGNFHYESYEKYAEAITSQLNQITFVSHHELDSKDQQLQIFGTACLAINLMQEQFVVLKCYPN